MLLSILSFQSKSMKNYIIFALFVFFLTSCQQKPNLQEYMVDSWQTTYLKIDMPTYQQSDSTNVFEDKFENNPQITARSTYSSDGTFLAWYLNQEGEIMGSKTLGKWKVEGDSLYVEYDYEGKDSKISYFIKPTEEGFEGISKHDWDSDGQFDDLLVMRTKRIKLDKE